jgi:prepilin-type N-terminal cleavage/methylation domain-containing protein
MTYNRRGFTLIETMVALVVLTIVVVGLGRFMGQFLHAESASGIRLVATSVATERLELIRADPRYTQLSALYGTGAGADTTGFPGYSGMRRRTTIVRDQTGAPARDFTTITVRVTHPAVPRDTVSVTATVARP